MKKPSGHAGVSCQTQIGICGDGALPKHDFVVSPRRHADRSRKRALRKRHRLKEFLGQDFAGVGIP
jgi:hypothetical protein